MQRDPLAGGAARRRLGGAACHDRSGAEAERSPVVDETAANAAVVEWRAKHEADYRRDWVRIAGLHPPELTVGDLRLVVHVSGDTRSLRVRDPNGPLARGFAGFTWFPIDARYRVTGRFTRDPQPQRLKVLNTYGDADEYNSEGEIQFELNGQRVTLRPFTTRPGRFSIVFRDASSGAETYETARFLYADLRDDGTTVLDFNEAYNPPCACNPHTTCPIPLRENRLPVKILAGEKAYAGTTTSRHRP